MEEAQEPQPASAPLTLPESESTADNPVRAGPKVEAEPAVPSAHPGIPQVTPVIIVPPKPKPKDAAPPVGAQVIAVNAGTVRNDWTNGVKPMIQSRRFWGLFFNLSGRIVLMATGSATMLNLAADPLVVEMVSGGALMVVGEVVQYWGQRKATRPLS